MKILRNRSSTFFNNFFILLVFVVYIYLRIALRTMSTTWILFSLLILIPGCVLLTQKMQNISYDAHDLVFDASGVSMYDGKRLVRHYNWDKYKTRCIVSHLGKPEWIYFSHEPLYFGSILRTQWNWHFEEGKYRGYGFCSSYECIGFKYRPEIYTAFRESCPDVELLRIDTNGEVYAIADDDREILVARILRPDEVSVSQREDLHCTVEILEAIKAVREAEAEKPKAPRAEKPVLTPEEMPVFTIYPKEKKNSEKDPNDWAREREEWEAEEEQRKKDKLWLKKFRIQLKKEEHMFEIIKNPVAQTAVMAAAIPEAAAPEAGEVPETEAAAVVEEPVVEEAVFHEEPAEEEENIVDIPGSTIRSVEEILASASRTVEGISEAEAAAEEEAAWAEEEYFVEEDDVWEEESFSDEDME